MIRLAVLNVNVQFGVEPVSVIVLDSTAGKPFGAVTVELSSRCVSRGGRPVSVTPRELGLLVALLRAEGAAVSREALLRDVWGHKSRVATRTVDTHIGELRRKLEPDPTRPAHIVTVRKFGYRLDPQGADGLGEPDERDGSDI